MIKKFKDQDMKIHMNKKIPASVQNKKKILAAPNKDIIAQRPVAAVK